MRVNTHESHKGTHETKIGSERSFGTVFAIFFALLGGGDLYQKWPEWGESIVGIGALGVSALFCILVLIAPGVLKGPNRLWFRFGLLLHKIINPLVLGLMFFLIITPVALVMRLLDKDPLRLRLDSEVKSYWIYRDPPGPEPKSMSRQF